MKYSLDKVDPLLTKLRISEGRHHIPPRSASKPSCQTNEDLISRSKQRRDYLQSSYEELIKYAVHENVNKPEEEVETYRGTTHRTRKLWDFDNENAREEPSPLLTMRRDDAIQTDKAWSAKDVRREARQCVTRQVQKDLLLIEEFNEGVKRRIAKYSPVAKRDDAKKLMEEKRQADQEAARLELKLNLSNEENKSTNVDDGYGKVLSGKPKAAPRKGPYRGINLETETNQKSEGYMSMSEARLQRIRELNKHNYEGRVSRYSEPEITTERQDSKSQSSSDTTDEIMPPPPRYFKLIKERTSQPESTELYNNKDEQLHPLPRYLRNIKENSHSQPELAEIPSSRPPFSPPTRATKSRSYTQSLSPPRRPITTRMQFSTPPSNADHQTINGSPSSYYVSTNADGDAASIRSGLSDGTPGQRSNSSSSRSNNVAQTTLSVILGRIEDAKDNFKKALVEDDVKKQAELASLITRLGEAAIAMRKLEDL
ncbi:hypothetical protein ACHAXN_005699 [Cyclotella atomus]